MNQWNRLAALVCVLILAGCVRTAPMLNISEPVSAHRSAEEVKTAILQAGIERQWVMTPIAPGVINARLLQREHTAEIRITYSPTGYAINYVSSRNLQAEHGQIHRSYNRWIQNLDRLIQLKLASQPVK